MGRSDDARSIGLWLDLIDRFGRAALVADLISAGGDAEVEGGVVDFCFAADVAFVKVGDVGFG